MTPDGEVDGERAHLGAQRDERGLALGLDLRLRVRGDARGLGRGLLLRLGDDLLAVLAGVLADAAGLGARVGELGGVLLERGLGLGCASSAFAMLPSIASARSSSSFCTRGSTYLPEEDEDDDEADRRPDDVVPRREERVDAASSPSVAALRTA